MAEQRKTSLLTRYHIYESSDGGATLHRSGEQLARSSQEALRKFFSEPPGQQGTFAAVSENALRLRTVQSRVVTSISDADRGDEPGEEPDSSAADDRLD